MKTAILRMISTTGNRTGSSLVELVVVVAVIAASVSLIAIHYQHRLPKVRLDATAEELAGTLRWARRLAITKRREYRVVIRPETRSYWIEGGGKQKVDQQRRLHQGITFAAADELSTTRAGLVEGGVPDGAVSFFPQGTSEGASIYLQDEGRGRWRTITIVPATGRVHLYQQKHT